MRVFFKAKTANLNEKQWGMIIVKISIILLHNSPNIVSGTHKDA